MIIPCTLGKNTAYSNIEDTIKGKEVVMINLHYESLYLHKTREWNGAGKSYLTTITFT